MTEREKMLAGELYDCGDKELLTQWHKAKNLTRDYNNTDSENLAEKDRILSDCSAGGAKTCGSRLLFMLTTETTFTLATTVRST